MELFVLEYLQSQYFWTTVAFLVLLGVMSKYVVPAVLGVLDARAARIAADLDAAARDREQAEGALAAYTTQLAQARKEAAELVTRARADAEAMAAERIRQVDADIARKTEDARKSIESAKQAALHAVQTEMTAIAIAVAEKVLAQTVDAKVAGKLVDEALTKGLH